MTTHTGWQFTAHLLDNAFRRLLAGTSSGNIGIGLNTMTDDNASDNEAQRAAAVSGLPSYPIVASGSEQVWENEGRRLPESGKQLPFGW